MLALTFDFIAATAVAPRTERGVESCHPQPRLPLSRKGFCALKALITISA